MMETLGLFLVLLSDLTGLALVGCAIVFAVQARAIRNGLAMRRFAEFATAVAVAVGFSLLVYFDGRFNVVPWLDLRGHWLHLAWFPRGLLVVAFVRFWLAFQQRAR
jgi:hypothetical protein